MVTKSGKRTAYRETRDIFLYHKFMYCFRHSVYSQNMCVAKGRCRDV